MLYKKVYANRSLGTSVCHLIEDILHDHIDFDMTPPETWYEFDGDGTMELWSLADDWHYVTNMCTGDYYATPELALLKIMLNHTKIIGLKLDKDIWTIRFANKKSMTLNLISIEKRGIN